jgi:hypothetical protein
VNPETGEFSARQGLTVYPPWIQIWDVAADSSQSCDRKSQLALLLQLALLANEVRILIFDDPAEH